jgi:hypothetical protein
VGSGELGIGSWGAGARVVGLGVVAGDRGLGDRPSAKVTTELPFWRASIVALNASS